MDRRIGLGLALAMVVMGCSSTHGMEIDVGVDAPPDAHREPVDASIDGWAAARCGAVTCGPAEDCCFLDGRCFDPSTERCEPLDAGPVDGGRPPVDAGDRACAATSECADGELCVLDGIACLGLGHCAARESVDCGGSNPRCGCDGVTYRNQCEAWDAGVRVLPFTGGCGVSDPERPTACGADSRWCEGTECCVATGLCLPADCPDCCEIPTTGWYPCASDAYCTRFRERSFCNATSCGGRGSCEARPLVSECPGLLEPVCGCDGRTYTNECLARSEGVRVAQPGACDET